MATFDVAVQIPFSDPVNGWTVASYAASYGPWAVGSALYCAVLEATFTGPLHVARSLDGGVSWALMDPTHAPAGCPMVVFDPATNNITSCVTSHGGATNGYKVNALRDLDCASNLWGSNYATAGVSAAFDIAAKAGMVVRSDGSKVLVATCNVASSGSPTKNTQQVYFATWNGTAWSGPIWVSDNTTISGSTSATAISAVLEPSTQKVHVVYEYDDFSGASNVYTWYHRTISSTGTLGTISTVDSYTSGAPKYVSIMGPCATVLFKGNIYVLGMYNTGTSASTVYVCYSASLAATPPWTFTRTTIAPMAYEQWKGIAGFLSPDGNTLEVLFQDDQNGAIGERGLAIRLFKTTSTTGSSWTTPTLFWDGWPIDEAMEAVSAADAGGSNGIGGIVAFGSFNYNTNVFGINRITPGGAGPIALKNYAYH